METVYTAPRKQNTACDACRTRKVKCNQLPGHDKCQHCIAKNYPCTHHAQLETEKKRGTGSRKGPRTSRSRRSTSGSPPPAGIDGSLASPTLERSLDYGTSAKMYRYSTSPGPSSSSSSHDPTISGDPYYSTPSVSYGPGTYSQYTPQTSVTASSFGQSMCPQPNVSYPGLPPPPHAHTTEFIAYLLSPDPTCTCSPNIQVHKQTKRQLEDAAYRLDFATQLVEVYFQVYHTRVPIVNPTRFRAQLKDALSTIPPSSAASLAPATGSGTPEPRGRQLSFLTLNSQPKPPKFKPIHRPLLAAIIAWGAKFSDHTLLVSDRDQSQQRAHPQNPNTGQDIQRRHGSGICRLLVDRAREVAEADKVFRVATPENIVVCLLLEPLQPLQSYPPADPQGLKSVWLPAAIRHLTEMQVNRRPSNPLPGTDSEEWGSMVFCFWIVCIADALCCSYFRKKPNLSDEDYDWREFAIASMPPEAKATGDNAFMQWYSSLHDLSICSRHMARTLCAPPTEAQGIPYDVLTSLVQGFAQWREQHLARVGVTSDLQSNGDYVAAVGACTSDCSYHVMWIILWQGIMDYGIKELNERARSSPSNTEIPPHVAAIHEVQRKISIEALDSATRIAGLAGVLTTNGYMRLDPNAMHWPIYTAGRHLARLGRQEVFNCIDGLNQNGFAYEESWAHARELQHIYVTAVEAGKTPGQNLPIPSGERRNTRGGEVPNTHATANYVYGAYASNLDDRELSEDVEESD